MATISYLRGLDRGEVQLLPACLDTYVEVKATWALRSVDADTADHYADIREDLRAAATPIPENDLWIAALCRQHHLAVASRDGHFDKVRGLKRVTW